MRYDVPVYFQRLTPGEYNASTGDYGPDKITEVERYASVASARLDTVRLLYGEIKQGCLTVHLQNHYHDPFDQIRIGAKVYRVDLARPLRVKHVFVVSEVQPNGKA